MTSIKTQLTRIAIAAVRAGNKGAAERAARLMAEQKVTATVTGEPIVRVVACICDGEYLLERYEDGHAKAGTAYSEILLSEWNEFLDHMETCATWHDFVRDLSNEQHEREQQQKEEQNGKV